MTNRPRISVVGAGVIGLSCAVRLAEAGFPVDVLARELPLETTSAVAGGSWLPYLAEPAAAVQRWARATYEALVPLAARNTGVRMLEGQLLGPKAPDWAPAMAGLVDVTPTVDPAPGHPRGWQLRIPMADMALYLPYLVRRLQDADGTITRLALGALPGQGLVVNCTGLASRALASDPSMHPIRGQIIRTTNPGIDTFWSVEDEDPASATPTYVLPHASHVVVGGTAQDGNWSTTPDPADADRILNNARALVPALAKAEIISHRVGLRPARPSIRLDTVRHENGAVVHCYGHGGSGVTLSWGCADDVLSAVVALVDDDAATKTTV